MRLVHSGKVRELYLDESRDPAQLLLVASDRLSIYDVVLPTPVPDKGAILTALSLYWFERTGDLVPNHVIGTDDIPAEFAGRAVRCRPLEMLPVECIARGYLTGLGLKEYQRTGAVSGVTLPAGLVEGSKLPEPIFTPTTKAPVGEHDEFMASDEQAEIVLAMTVFVYATNILVNAVFGAVGDRWGWRRTVQWFGVFGSAVGLLLWWYVPHAVPAGSTWGFWVSVAAGCIFGCLLAGFVPMGAIMPALAPDHKGAAMAMLRALRRPRVMSGRPGVAAPMPTGRPPSRGRTRTGRAAPRPTSRAATCGSIEP